MSMSLGFFDVDNIRRYISVKKLDNGHVDIHVSWPHIISLVKRSNLPLHEVVFEDACDIAINRHICNKYIIDYNKSPNAINVLPYLIANIIYGTAHIILYTDYNPNLNEDSDEVGLGGVEKGKALENILVYERIDDK